MEQRELGRSGIKISSARPGPDVDVGRLRQRERRRVDPRRSTTRSTRASTSSTRPTCTAGGTTRRCSEKRSRARRDKAIVVTKFGQVKQADGKQTRRRPPGIRAAGLRRQPEAPGNRGHRPLLPASRRPEHADRGHGRRDEAPRRARQGARARPVGGAPETIRRAHKVHPIAAVQNEYSLLYRKEGEETLKASRELGITLVPYAPLGRSMLTGTVHGKADLPEGDRRLQHPRFQGDALEKNVALVKRWKKSPAKSAARPRSSCSPGCSRRARTSCRFPAPSAASASTRTWALEIKLTRRTSNASLTRRRSAPAPARAIPRRP